MSHSLKIRAVTFTHFNTCRQLQFEKNLMSRFRENFVKADFGPKKRPIYPPTQYQFSLKTWQSHFYPVVKICPQV